MPCGVPRGDELVERTPAKPWNARRRASNHQHLAGLFQRLGQYEQAPELYQQLQKSPRRFPERAGAPLTNVGVLYRRLDDPWKALETYEAAKRLFAREQHQDGQERRAQEPLARSCRPSTWGDLPAALRGLHQARCPRRGESQPREAMQGHLYRGEALFRQGRAGRGETRLPGALASATSSAPPEDQLEALLRAGPHRAGGAAMRSGLPRATAASRRIESVRSRLQLSTLKPISSAEQRDVYDALIELLSQHADTAEIFNLMERSRGAAPGHRCRSAEPGPGRGSRPTPPCAVQARLDGRTLLVEFWVGPQAAAVLWVTPRSACSGSSVLGRRRGRALLLS